MSFEPCTLKRHEEGDSLAFQAKLTGAGANDMCNMQELTKDSISACSRTVSRASRPPKAPLLRTHPTMPPRARAVFTTRTHLYGCLSLALSRVYRLQEEIVYLCRRRRQCQPLRTSAPSRRSVTGAHRRRRRPPWHAHTSLSCLLHCVVPLLFSPDAPPSFARVVCASPNQPQHRYRRAARRMQLPMPHVYQLVDQTYHQMMTEQQVHTHTHYTHHSPLTTHHPPLTLPHPPPSTHHSPPSTLHSPPPPSLSPRTQSILISGESSAGKTGR